VPNGGSKLPPAVLTWRRETRLGEQIAIFGFPYLGTLASSGTFTRGDVTALAGISNNSAHFQLSAPVQPGNSGGPVVDEQGNVIGVVVAKLNALAVARVRGDIPQNVNFAIKSARAISFLETNGVAITVGSTSAPRMSGPDLAERLRDGAVLVTCTGGGSTSAASSNSTKNVGR
jgi:S1-C subfamily serine protease